MSDGIGSSGPTARRVNLYNAETDALCSALGHKNLEVVQTEPGKARHTITVLSLGRTHFEHVRQRVAWTACFTAEPHRISTLLLILPPRPDYIVRGHSVEEGEFLFYPPGIEHISRNHQPGEFLHCSFDEPALRESYRLCALEDLSERTFRFRTAPEVLTSLRGLVRQGLKVVESHPQLAEDEVWQINFERSIFSEHVRLLCAAQPSSTTDERRSITTREHIVRGARNYLHERMTKPVYTAELCQAVKASERALQQAFMSLLGVSPMQYLKLRRLQMVRRILRDSLTKATSVKCVALNHGFWDLGRFAGEYRALFGERPSTTLSKLGSSRDFNELKMGI